MDILNALLELFWTACWGALLANITIWILQYMKYKDWLTIKLWPAMVLSYVFWQLLFGTLALFAMTSDWVVTLAPLWKLFAQMFFYAIFFYVTWPKAKNDIDGVEP